MVDLVKWVWTRSLSYTLDIFNFLFLHKNHIWSNWITAGLKYLQIVGDNHTQSSDLIDLAGCTCACVRTWPLTCTLALNLILITIVIVAHF